jgi:hypothetical protein
MSIAADFSSVEKPRFIVQEKSRSTAERLIAARSLVTGKNKPVTGNDTSDGRVSDRR